MFVNAEETYENNGIEVIVDNNGTLWLNTKHLEEKLDHKKLVVITRKQCLEHRKHRFELVDEPKKQPNRIFLHEKVALKTIMHCRIMHRIV